MSNKIKVDGVELSMEQAAEVSRQYAEATAMPRPPWENLAGHGSTHCHALAEKYLRRAALHKLMDTGGVVPRDIPLTRLDLFIAAEAAVIVDEYKRECAKKGEK